MNNLNNLNFHFIELKNANNNLDDLEILLNDEEEVKIGLEDPIYNTPIFDKNWSLLCNFDDRAIEDESKSMYVLYLNKETTIKDLLLLFKKYPTYGFFECIDKIGNNKYKLTWGT